MTIQALPVELLIDIFAHLGTSDESALALVRCSSTCRFLRSIGLQSHIWQPIYNARYTIADPINEATRLADTNEDYAKMYPLRCELDRKTLRCLDAIVSHTGNRLRLAETVAYGMGLDVYDILLKQSSRTWPKDMVRAADVDVDQVDTISPTWLSRPYWAKEVLGVITRLEAFRGWKKVVLYPEYTSYAEGISCFSGFRGINPSQVMSDLHDLGVRCEQHLRDRRSVLDRTDPEYNVVEVCREICMWMRLQGFSPASAANYHRIDNHFLDAVLTTNKDTLPLSLVVIFVALARHVGIKASPVGFPQHVHAVVPGSSSSDGYIHLDIFNSDHRLLLPLADLERFLDGMGVSAAQRRDLLSPTTVRALCLRAAANIQQSCRQEHIAVNVPRLEYLRDCHYSVMSSVLMLSDPHNFGGGQTALEMIAFCEDRHPLDWCILQREVTPLVGSQHRPNATVMGIRDQLSRMVANEDLWDPPIKRTVHDLPRAVDGTKIKHHVGTIVRHARLGYVGVITDWNVKCEQPETWIVQMGVDELPRGREQPFYTVSAVDGTVRYVAEENIDLDTLPKDIWSSIRDLAQQGKNVDKLFDRAEVRDGAGRFVPGTDLQREYPGDYLLCMRALGYDIDTDLLRA